MATYKEIKGVTVQTLDLKIQLEMLDLGLVVEIEHQVMI